MRTATTTALLAIPALLGLGTTALPLTAATASTATAASSERERGVVLECTGSAHGRSAYVDLYENHTYGNYVQVVLDDDPDTAKSREPERDFLVDGHVRTGVTIKGKRVSITGTAVRTGHRTHVHEETDDADQHIVSDGYHRRLATDLTLRYGATRVPLDCSPAFRYDLTVTKEPIED